MKRLLLATRRIEVEALMRDNLLSPRAFRWAVGDSETTTGARVTRLEYGSGHPPAFFQFDVYRRQHYACYSRGGAKEREQHFTGGWSQQALHVKLWMARLTDPSHPDAPGAESS